MRQAAEGDVAARGDFARRYEPVVRAYLKARWRNLPLSREVDDAVQDVFVECFRGALGRADPERPGGFRPFLYGVVKKVALMSERRRARDRLQLVDGALDRAPSPDEESLATIFERAWAKALLDAAGARHRELAAAKGEAAVRRMELLRLRFEEGRPIREIAALWQVDPARLHHEYATARAEFRGALREVVGFHHSGDAEAVDRECRRLLEILG